MRSSLDILDEHYAFALGCTPEELNSGRLVVVSCERIGGIRFAKGSPLVLFSIAKGSGAVVSVYPGLKEAVDRALDGRNTLDGDACEVVRSVVTPLVDVDFWFNGCRLFCAPDTFVEQSFGDVRDVTGLDETSAALYAKWGGRVFGQIVDGQTVAWAAVKPLSDIAWDLSIQTLPEHRGRGYAKSAVSAAVKNIFENGKLATWGTDTTNTASLKTAHSVGFQHYGFDFGCVVRI